jgi:four helix bundle protein
MPTDETADERDRPLEMRERTLQFAELVVQACRTIPRNLEGRHVSDQLFRSATSVAANYRAARRARSRREFIAKIGLVIEEADESLFWLESAMRINLLPSPKGEAVRKEADELIAILYSTRQTAMERLSTPLTRKGS